jgi:tRNA modification GTPase
MLCGSDRAIVTPIPGTTRDLISEVVDIRGLAVTIIDTAGARDTLDVVEQEGVARGLRAAGVADLVLVVVDASEPLTADDMNLLSRTEGVRRLIVANKCDRSDNGVGLCRADRVRPDVRTSALTGAGIDDVRNAIERALTAEERLRDSPSISNARHVALLEAAREHLHQARVAAREGFTPEEFVLIDLPAARARFDEIVGTRTAEDVLKHIFERFCIGK